MIEWYHGYLIHRNLYIEIGDESLEISTAVGFPQGGVCSAAFWIIAFDPAITIINSYGLHGNGFADDCGAVIGGTRISQMFKKVQEMLDCIVAWGKTCGLTFNEAKTVVVLFTRRKPKFTCRLTMNNKIIDMSDSVKYLGITIDKSLTWRLHIRNTLAACKRLLLKLFNITRSNWGP